AAFMDKQPLAGILAGLAGRNMPTGFSITDGRRSGRTATNEDGRHAAHARPDFDRALGQPFPLAGAADAVSLSEGAAGRRLHRTRPRADRFRRGIRPDPGADGLPRRSYWRPQGPARGPHA